MWVLVGGQTNKSSLTDMLQSGDLETCKMAQRDWGVHVKTSQSVLWKKVLHHQKLFRYVTVCVFLEWCEQGFIWMYDYEKTHVLCPHVLPFQQLFTTPALKMCKLKAVFWHEDKKHPAELVAQHHYYYTLNMLWSLKEWKHTADMKEPPFDLHLCGILW